MTNKSGDVFTVVKAIRRYKNESDFGMLDLLQMLYAKNFYATASHKQ